MEKNLPYKFIKKTHNRNEKSILFTILTVSGELSKILFLWVRECVDEPTNPMKMNIVILTRIC